MRAARWRFAWIAAAWLAGAAHAHDDGHGRAPEREILPPGYGVLEFTPPTPGSYSLPPLGPAAGGEVLSGDGTPTDLGVFLGEKLCLLSFVYASCDDVKGCPLATAVLHRVAARLREAPALASRLRLVTLSFDPARDTPEVMRRYGAGLAGDGVDWSFLTAVSEEKLQPILDAYDQSVTRETDATGGQPSRISHILRVFLIDRTRQVRNVYSVSFLHPDLLLADVQTLLLEEAASTAGASDAGHEAPAGGLRGPGDRRQGYERRDYRTASLAIAARRGEPTDLLAALSEPPLGLPEIPVPPDNPITAQKVALGRKLFFDRRLSGNGTFSCAMCHIPEQGFTSNELATAVGIEGRTVRRNAPSLYNAAYARRLFHDGRETRLEHQVWGPLLARNEMGNPSIGAVLETLRAAPDYTGLFEAAFPQRGLAMESVGMALASYQRTLVSGDSRFDRWRYGGDDGALSPEARRGFALFTGKAGCHGCHPIGPDHALFSDGAFHNTGIGQAAPAAESSGRQRILIAPGYSLEVEREIVARVSEPRPSDLGRYEITQEPADRWKYRTPSLRNVALSAPYMHDGSLGTLREVVAFYDRGGAPSETLDPRIRPLALTDREIGDLVAFLESLTGSDAERLVADAFAAPIGDVGSADPSAPLALP